MPWPRGTPDVPSSASRTAGVGGWLQGAGAELKMTHILGGDPSVGHNPLSEGKWKTQKPSVIWLAQATQAFVVIL